MKKILIMIILLLSLTSCEEYVPITQEEKLNKIKECNDLWFWYYQDGYGDINCNSYIEDKVFDCIKEYTKWIDKKYNNPDNISDLREENYSEVVKTCNEIFWDKK